MAEKVFYTKLKNRGMVTVSGPDSRNFLQGLISNDINLLDKKPMIYSCLLTPQGKFLYDFFITEEGGSIRMECEGGERASGLAKKLGLYKLRANVTIECKDSIDVYAGIGNIPHADPRHPQMGFRAFERPDLPKEPFETWDHHRILLTVPDGSRDMIPEKSTLLESNIDQLNGISWDKGCYMGQELTARMNYRALVKKHLKTVKLDELPEGVDLRSTCGDIGIALVKN